MPKWLKNTIAIIISLIIVCTVGALIFHHLLNKSLPASSGEKVVEGLTGEVSIYRDAHAVPYIYAGSEEDAAFALGYLHAQERLFQMDIARRAAEGRLSEVFGPKTVMFDKMFKTLGMDRTARSELSVLSKKTLDILEAYSKGVNASIKEMKHKYPIEFDALQYEPYLWQPIHSLMIAKMMAWELNISWWGDITFAHLIQKLGIEKVKEIFPEFPENAPTIIPSGIEKYGEISTSMVETDKAFRNFIGFNGTHIGSNNWVINGAKSSSGKPIIANDPHLAFQAPGRWYAAVIRGGALRAEGVTIPGAPGIVIGKNDNISWVLTNVMSDDADFYAEKIDSTGKKYFFNGNWHDLAMNKYFIAVKDSERAEITVKSTHRGPIISDIHSYVNWFPNKSQKEAVLSMRWIGNDPTNEMDAVLDLNRAQNWTDFKGAIKKFSAPGQNFVYADKEGNIGYICAAKIPIRNNNSSAFVSDGTNDIGDWKGFVPFEEMPMLFNPPENFIASANNKTVKNFPYHISTFWEPPSRIERIIEMLNSKNRHTVEDFKQYQNDFISPYAREITPFILEAFKNIKIKNSNLKTALNLLKGWDFEINQYSQVPSVYETFFNFLLKNTFEDEMGPNLFKEFVFLQNIPLRTILKLLQENNSSWFDNTSTKNIESRDEIIRQSLSDALTFLEQNLSDQPDQWQWGKLHKVIFKHFFHGRFGLMDKYVDIGPYDIGGDATTVFNTEYSFNTPYENNLGPSMRYIYDFAKPEEFYLILNTGQSGHIMSDHYRDMTEMWLTGRYLKIITDDNIIKNSGFDLLKLR